MRDNLKTLCIIAYQSTFHSIELLLGSCTDATHDEPELGVAAIDCSEAVELDGPITEASACQTDITRQEPDTLNNS